MRLEDFYKSETIKQVLEQVGITPDSIEVTDNPDARAKVLNGLKERGYNNPDAEMKSVIEAAQEAYPGMSRPYVENLAYTLVANLDSFAHRSLEQSAGATR